MYKVKTLDLAWTCLFLAIPCSAATIVVDPNGSADYITIQAGIDNAANGDTIVAADGIYTGAGNRDIDFTGKTLTVRSDNGPENCIIDCQASSGNKHRGFIFHSGESNDSVLKGFTITNGYGPEEDVGYGPQSYGGGIFCRSSSPTIDNCIIEGNSAKFGGAIAVFNSNPTIRHCKIISNLANSTGGGIWYRYGSLTVRCCIISDNVASHRGGVDSLQDGITLINSIITSNSASYGSGGIRCAGDMAVITNCTFCDNSAENWGGGIWCQGSSATIQNCIVWNNTAPTDPGLGSSTMYPSVINVLYSDVQGGYSGQGNINSNPDFANPAGDDYHLSVGSPCIDSGDPAYSIGPGETDIDGHVRVLYGRVGMGADEYVAQDDPAMMVEPTQLKFEVLRAGGPVSQVLTISNINAGVLNWQINENCSWLQAVPLTGATTAGQSSNVNIQVDAAVLSSGYYLCPLAVTDSNGINQPAIVDVALSVTEITPSSFWKNQVTVPNDPFFVQGTPASQPGWVKFTSILLDGYDPNIVYYQDSNQYTFHYDFATEQMDPFIGMTVPEYFDVVLYEGGQEASLGALIIPYDDGIKEYGIQFIRQDPYTREQIRDMFYMVESTVVAGPAYEAFYFPTYEQYPAAQADSAWLLAQGIKVGSIAQWIDGNICYSAGWALGELKYFAGEQIQSAYLSGQLKSNDILLTDGVPAEIPVVAGVMTLSPTTPNSHVAILAQTYGIPFVFLGSTDDADTAQQMVGLNVLMCVEDSGGACTVELTDADEAFQEYEVDEMLAMKEPGQLSIMPMTPLGAYSGDTNDLSPADIGYFGGKASNYGILRDAIAAKCPVATALSFDLWNAFLDQILPNGKSLRTEINTRLSGLEYPPVNMAALSTELDYIRENLFKNTSVTSFNTALQDAIVSTLQDPQYGFDIYSKIRFRSSTNVEDSDQFIGAGLYDSFSGCLADDLDGDNSGPSICDPSKGSERGVFRAIRKVFASFYNDNAYLERLRYAVEPNDVGMALLVHHSFPDEFELANGVATLEKNGSGTDKTINLVTQKGAVSVANPQDGSVPEEVQVYVDGEGNKTITLIRESNLVILGDTVMDRPADYNDLTELLLDVSDEFESVTGKTDYILDFEYKKLSPGGAAMPAGGLVVKQVRQIRRIDPVELECPEPVEPTFCINPCVYDPTAYYQQRSFTSPDGLFIYTSYYLYCPGICISDAFSHWDMTEIVGLTTEPICLFSCASQCYTSSHHNWCENFFFEPMFEPGISQCIVDQLHLMNVKSIELYNITYCGQPGIRYYDFDDQVFNQKPYLGDFDHDGDIDVADLIAMARRWLDDDCAQCGGADLNCDDKVNHQDFVELGTNWQVGANP